MIMGDLMTVTELKARGMESPAADVFLHDGEILCTALAECLHTGVEPPPDMERETRGFMAYGRNFSEGAFGAAVRKSGMSVPEASAKMAQGEWDPFADVAVPPAP
jgi:hypothetical protein